MEAIILFSAIADHEEKQSLVKTVCMYSPIVGMKLCQSSEWKYANRRKTGERIKILMCNQCYLVKQVLLVN